ILGKPLLMGKGEAPDAARLESRVAGVKLEWLLYVIGFVAVGVSWVLIQFQDVVGWLLFLFGIALVLYVIYYAVRMLERVDRVRIFAVMLLIVGSILFSALFEQAGSSLNLFTDRYVDRGGVPAAVLQTINLIYIISLAPLFAWLWTWLGRRGLDP